MHYWKGTAARTIAALAVVFAVTWINVNVLPPNSTTCALLLIFAVVGISALLGYIPSLAASAGAAIGFGVVLPPPGSIRIDDPEDWLAFAVFLVTALTVNRFAENARFREQESASLRLVAERLLAIEPSSLSAMAARMPQIVAEVFRLPGTAFYFRDTQALYRAGGALESVTRATLERFEPSENTRHLIKLPVLSSAHMAGVLTLSGARLSSSARQALPAILGLAIERARSENRAAEEQAYRKRFELRAALLSAVAHEFRTPLTVIKGAATELLTSPQGSDDLLTIVDEEADRMNRLLGEAIELGRVEAQSLRLHRVPTPIGALVSATVAEFAETGRVIAQPGLPTQMADVEPELIAQVLRHLVGNALKYSPPESQVQLDVTVRERDAVISLRDFGPGIAAEDIDHVFEPFFRGAAQSDVPGTGMGLAIARSLVEAHGGKIWVLSYRGQGSVFSFSVPLMLGHQRGGG
ncbi:MAG: ATP-binding protein [Bryobacteraceae bacterium]